MASFTASIRHCDARYDFTIDEQRLKDRVLTTSKIPLFENFLDHAVSNKNETEMRWGLSAR